jgi:hypothetical protein
MFDYKPFEKKGLNETVAPVYHAIMPAFDQTFF